MLQKLIHKLPAGLLPGDQSIEILADRETRKLFFIQNGSVYSFKDLSNAYKRQLLVKLLADKPALKDLGHLGYSKALEEFAFCLFGGADSNPDFDEKGKLGRVENFRCGLNCKCLSWKSKKITYNKNSQTIRPLNQFGINIRPTSRTTRTMHINRMNRTHRPNMIILENITLTRRTRTSYMMPIIIKPIILHTSRIQSRRNTIT